MVNIRFAKAVKTSQLKTFTNKVKLIILSLTAHEISTNFYLFISIYQFIYFFLFWTN